MSYPWVGHGQDITSDCMLNSVSLPAGKQKKSVKSVKLKSLPWGQSHHDGYIHNINTPDGLSETQAEIQAAWQSGRMDVVNRLKVRSWHFL